MTMNCRDIRESISSCVDGEASPGEMASVRESSLPPASADK